MIVDEERDILEKVKLYLQHDDITVVTAANSRQALEQMEKKHEDIFDLILINTRMPGSKKTTALYPLKPLAKEQATGIESFLQKPFTKNQLREFVKQRIQ